MNSAATSSFLYQGRYRETRPEYAERNRRDQRRRDRKRRLGDLVKNNLALDVKRLESEVWLVQPGTGDLVKNNAAFSELLIFRKVGEWEESAA